MLSPALGFSRYAILTALNGCPRCGVAERDPRQECSCPPYVVRCAHWAGQVVYIGFLHGQYEAHGPTKVLIESNDPDVRRHVPCISVAFGTEVLALEEFARRAELLRLGGGDG